MLNLVVRRETARLLKVKFYANPSSCGRVVSDGQTNMTKLTAVIDNFWKSSSKVKKIQ
jgi:hypothetical protein